VHKDLQHLPHDLFSDCP
jgi:ferric-chelate reductase